MKAAEAVKDGELLPQPVPEGQNFAVIWRRRTIGATAFLVLDAAGHVRVPGAGGALDVASARLLDGTPVIDVKAVLDEIADR